MSIFHASVRLRLTVLVMVVFGVALAAMAVVLVRQVERALVADTRENAIRELTMELTGVPAGGLGEEGSEDFGYYDADGNRLTDAEVAAAFEEIFGSVDGGQAVWAGGGVVVGPVPDVFSFDVLPGSGDLTVVEGDLPNVLDPNEIPPVTELDSTPDRITLGVPVAIGSSEMMFAVSRSLHPVAVNLATITGILWWAIPLLILLVGLAVWFVVGRALAPVEEMAEDVERFSSDHLGSRVSVPDSDDEIAHMARTVNGMLDRIETSVSRQQQFVSDASHELRSPIATIGAEMEIAGSHPEATDWDRTVDVVLTEQRRLGALVDDLLLLSRFDEGAGKDLAEVDLDDVVFDEAQRCRSVPVDVRDVDPVRMRGDRRLLARMVGNLVANAERHATDAVRVSLRGEDGRAILIIDDDGPGVPVEERERIFRRFARVEEGRSRNAGGTGLGLAIVQAVAAAHGGRVAVEDAPLGGARFVVTIPIGDEGSRRGEPVRLKRTDAAGTTFAP